MIKARSHLESIVRSGPGSMNRGNYLRLDMNENPVGLPDDFIRMVLQDINAKDLSTYPFYSVLQEKVAEINAIEPQEVCLANGSDAAIRYIFEAFISPGDRIVLTDPTFAMYPIYSRLFQADCQLVAYESLDRFPVDAFIAGIDRKTRLAVVVNPNNPTGAICTPAELERIVHHCYTTGTLVVVDEAYYFYYKHTAISLLNRFENLVVLRTFSKLCGLAGVRLGYAVASPGIVDTLIKVKPTFDVNAIACLFAQRLLEQPALIETLVADANAGKNVLIQGLREQSIEYHPGEANFVLIRCNAAVEKIIRSLESQGILVSGGFSQPLLKHYIRVTVGNAEQMKTFLNTFLPLWENTTNDR